MESDQLFNWLVRLHVEHNLPIVAPHINDGKADFVEEGDIGYDHRTPNDVKRFLIVANGDTLVEKLTTSEMIEDPEKLKFTSVPRYDDFHTYFNKHRGDGAYIAHLNDARIARVMEIANGHPKGLSASYSELPEHFIALDKSVGNEECGNKTRLAMRIPRLPILANDNVHTFQIKGTLHGELGMGIVTHFHRGGMEMFYLDYDPNSDGPFIDEAKGIIGVHERYTYDGSKYTLTEKKQVGLEEYIV
ncbi:hypothetical protein COV17_03675 [Candidatus Woesearchaeota archaeon CG10_big_fil_rev_8_21_14_0_10_36_11]|nr:MAG: hypothetical protein COV17_03675 [Candidatus Woesearchaeota archaeon CG10_big_fil_rev_8_21_14_0_10_36_11]